MLNHHLHGLPFYSLRLRSDLFDLHNGCDQQHTADATDAVRSLASQGFNPCQSQPDHWVFCRGSQRVHLYGPDELDRFARRCAPRDSRPANNADLICPRSPTKETTA